METNLGDNQAICILIWYNFIKIFSLYLYISKILHLIIFYDRTNKYWDIAALKWDDANFWNCILILQSKYKHQKNVWPVKFPKTSEYKIIVPLNMSNQ